MKNFCLKLLLALLCYFLCMDALLDKKKHPPKKCLIQISLSATISDGLARLNT